MLCAWRQPPYRKLTDVKLIPCSNACRDGWDQEVACITRAHSFLCALAGRRAARPTRNRKFRNLLVPRDITTCAKICSMRSSARFLLSRSRQEEGEQLHWLVRDGFQTRKRREVVVGLADS